MKNNASLIYGLFLIIGDFLALVAAFTAAFILRVTLDSRPTVASVTSLQYLKIFLLLLPFWLIIFGLLGLYNKNTYENRFSEFGRLFIGSFVGILFVISYSYITNTAIFPARLVTLYGFLLALCFMLLFRTLARAIRRSLFSYGIGVNNVLIVGNTSVTDELITSLENTKLTGYRIIGIVSTNTKHRGQKHDHHIFTSFEEALRKLKDESIHSIIQTELYAAQEKNNEILTHAQENHIAYRFVPGNSELFVGNIEVDLFHSIPVIAVHQTALVGWGKVVKRLFDIVVGSLMLIFATPLMFMIAVLIKIFDPGTVFYRQERLSRFNNTFKIFKFRSMKIKFGGKLPEEAFAEMGRPELAREYRENGDFLAKDPRISRIGEILRKTSLDELPQLINVVRGDISIVGPRALVKRDLDKYSKKNLILSVKSGMTGLAVISGRKDISFEERRKLDLYYVQNWTFWGDIVILARTVSSVLFHRGAR
jgi:exopolysaccharide biosynthesis polyprenyl glycosylphosphotransferase